jgi:hypothetical protein
LLKPKGLFHKIKNRFTRQRYVVSTIRKGENLFETVVFAANFFYIPRSLKRPALIVESPTQDDAWDTHHQLKVRLTLEPPDRVFQEYRPA